jgi:hypothetical protein
MNSSDIISRLAHQLDTKSASTLFINGAPGSGKTYLLKTLLQELPKDIPKIIVLGPYDARSTGSIVIQMLNDFYELSYLSKMPDQDVSMDLNDTWRWLKKNLHLSIRQKFVVLIDLVDTKWDDFNSLRIWFSSMRYLEHLWDSSSVGLIFLITGFWDHPGLENYYGNMEISFPYTVSQNYILWEEIPYNEANNFLGSHISDLQLRNIFSQLLHEVSGGNPRVMQEIMGRIDTGELSVKTLLRATGMAALDGSVSQGLLDVWTKLPIDSIEVLNRLLAFREIPISSLSLPIERLRIVGIIKEQISLKNRSITLRSWYVELLIRLHANELGLSGFPFPETYFSELMPTIYILNREAYRLLQEIETLLRNFLVTQLWDYRPKGELLFTDWFYKENNNYQNRKGTRKKEIDAQERADDWKERSFKNGLPVDLNPDIAYLSLSDLAGILNELATKKFMNHWKQVCTTIEHVVYIRDAVMHNQLIEISDLIKIYNLQNEIISTLNEVSELSSIGKR